jgi:hypothetical protein
MANELVRAMAVSMCEELETALRDAADKAAPTELVDAMYDSLCSIRDLLDGEDEFALRTARAARLLGEVEATVLNKMCSNPSAACLASQCSQAQARGRAP